MVPGLPLDPRHHQLVQLASLRDEVPLRHLWLLRRLHRQYLPCFAFNPPVDGATVPPKGDPDPRGPRRRRVLLPLHRCRATRVCNSLPLRRARREHPLQAPNSRIPQRLRHATHPHLLRRVRPHGQAQEHPPREPTDQRLLRAHRRPRLVHPLLGHFRRRRLPRRPLCPAAHHSLLVRPQRCVLPTSPPPLP